MLAMQLNLPFVLGRDDASASATVHDCARRVSPRRDLVHACCLVDEGERCCAPLYIWRSTRAMCNFLMGDPFGEIVEIYGRPRVRTWNVLELDTGDSTITPRFAVREVDSVDAEASLWTMARRETERHREILDRPGLAAHAAVLDPDRWEIARFSLWRDRECAGAPNADCVQTYRVV